MYADFKVSTNHRNLHQLLFWYADVIIVEVPRHSINSPCCNGQESVRMIFQCCQVKFLLRSLQKVWKKSYSDFLNG